MTDWQPIETAPKDGTEFLACDVRAAGEPMAVISLAAQEDILLGFPWRMQGGSTTYSNDAFTHWMPLPEPPVME